MNETLRPSRAIAVPSGVGFYTVPEAALLVGLPARNIRRWLGGYSFRQGEGRRRMKPLWRSELAMIDDRLELGFRDLIELRFVKAFLDAGVGLHAVRNCLIHARELVDDERPFSTRRFRTDGRTIFLESLGDGARRELLDLRKRQYVFAEVIERTFKDLDLDDGVVVRWRPYRGKPSIVLDPERAFGQPIAAASGVPVVALVDAVAAEDSVARVSRLFEVPVAVVRDAIGYHEQLHRAA
jgi:uncharacterized protein (DUF433 family)